ncbi:MAG: hypothetical protein V7L05_00045 [Nostoc sp.]
MHSGFDMLRSRSWTLFVYNRYIYKNTTEVVIVRSRSLPKIWVKAPS